DVRDRFLERNQALRLAVADIQHLVTLLGYLEQIARTRGDERLRAFCSDQRARLMPVERNARAAAIELGSDPDAAIEPLDDSPAGKVAHRAAYAFGAVGEWLDRRAGRLAGDAYVGEARRSAASLRWARVYAPRPRPSPVR